MDKPAPRNRMNDPLMALAAYLRQAEGLDTSWVPRGSCQRYPGAKDRTGFTWWMASSSDSDNLKQNGKKEARLEDEKAKMALMVCHSCPVQYDCAEFGARSGATAGIYGVRTSSLGAIRKRHLYDDPEWGAGTESVEQFVTARRLGA